MYIVIFCSFLALFFTVLESKFQIRGGMKLGFILVTFLGIIHYDYGNDYMSYFNVYNEVTSYSFDLKGILDGYYYHEPGWALLCWLFKPIGGFFMMVAVLNVIQNYIIYNFIKCFVDYKWWPMSIFVYLFTTSFYLMSFSMMRQEFVVIVFLGLWTFIEKRKWLLPLIILYLCSFVHSSAQVLIPFVFWGYLPMKNGKLIGVFYAILLLVLWLFQDILNNIFQFALTIDEGFSGYANTYGTNGNNGVHIGLGFVIYMIPFVLSILLLLSKRDDLSVQTKQLIALSAISFLITPFGQIIQLVGRLSIYFSIFSIGAIPFVYKNVKNGYLRISLVALYTFVVLFDYYSFFQNPVWVDKYSNFHTIFSHIL